MDYYILHTVLLIIILLFIIAIICYHSAKHISKRTNILLYQQYKIENNEVSTKNQTCYYFDDIIKLKDCNFDNILLDKKPNDNILVYDISYKTLIGSKPLRIRFDKIDLLKFMMEQHI